MSETDRQRLLELFRKPLEDGDVLSTPDVVGVGGDGGPPLLPPADSSGPSGAVAFGSPNYQSSTAASAGATLSVPTWVVVVGVGVVVMILLGVIAYLLVTQQSESGSKDGDAPGHRGHEADDDYDEEVADLTENDGPPPPTIKESVGAGLAERRMVPSQRGMPQMPQMRPNMQVGGAEDSRPAAAPRAGGHGGDEGDPMFQALDE